MTCTKKDQLLERIHSNYLDFLIALQDVSRDTLFCRAKRIAVVTEAYEMLTKTYAWDEDCEIEYYLMFRNPLVIIADAWEQHQDKISAGFPQMMSELSSDSSIITQYPLMEVSCNNAVDISDTKHKAEIYIKI